MPEGPAILETLLKHDRQIVVAGLMTVIILAWGYILLGGGTGMSVVAMSSTPLPGALGGVSAAILQPADWTFGYALLMFVMWWVMMVAMMLPSAAPMLLLFAGFNRTRQRQGSPFVPTSVFATGYLVAWGGFSAVAVGLQWGLESLGLLSAMMESTDVLFCAGVLLAAGAYQLTPLKRTCLRHCQNPFRFVTHRWRTGTVGAFRMGLEHGIFCLGCCWFLMTLLFVGGVMNLYWIVGLAVFILLEKTVPAGHWFNSLAGVALILWGGWLLANVR